MQIARGVGILLVTAGHSEPIMDVYPFLFHLIYAFHMPLFFFLSGFFSVKTAVIGSVREWREVVLPRLFSLIIPYFAITLAYSSLKSLVPHLAKRPVVFSDLLTNMLVYPIGNPALFLWFLYTIIILRALAPLLMKLNPYAILAVFSVFQIVTPEFRLFGIVLVLHYGIYYYLGLKTASLAKDRFLSLLGGRILPLGSACVFAAAFLAEAHWHMPLFRFPAAASGILFVLSACSIGARFFSGRFLEYLGRHSLQIYLLQYFFIFPLLFLLERFGLPGRLIVWLTFAAGLAGPLFIVTCIFPRSRIISLLFGGMDHAVGRQGYEVGQRAV